MCFIILACVAGAKRGGEREGEKCESGEKGNKINFSLQVFLHHFLLERPALFSKLIYIFLIFPHCNHSCNQCEEHQNAVRYHYCNDDDDDDDF